MRCKHCDTEVPDGGTRCPRCGKSLAATTPPSSTVATPLPPGGKVQPTAKPTQTALPEQTIAGRFSVVRVLGQGGMGQVYQGFDRQLERTVAIKRLLPELSRESQSARRFVVEAKSIASLNHQNVVNIYDIGDDARGKYIVMEFVDGESLADRLRRVGKLSVRDTIHLLLQVGRALQLAHERGVVHRDIKPGNILITARGVPKLADFGLAQLAREQDLTRTGTAMGTWSYASPEQMTDAKRVDQRSDIFSCGAMMYEMVTGEVPRHIRERAIPAPMRPIILKCLAKSPENRFQTVQQLLAALSTAYRKVSAEEQTPPPPPQPPRTSGSPVPQAVADATTREMILWQARRRPWSRPIRTVVGVMLFLFVMGAGDAINQQIIGVVVDAQGELTQPPTGGTAGTPGSPGVDTASAIEPLLGIPYAGVLMAIALWLALAPVWGCLGTRYRMTPTRLVVTKGLLFVRETDYPLHEIREVRLSLGLWGTLLRYGNLQLMRVNKSPVTLEGVPRARDAKDAIATQVARSA